MAQEIELKFIVQSEAMPALRQWLDGLDGKHSAARQLLNIYFETPDLQLRRHDMGLRIRGDGPNYEMTMKTAGVTIGGLHQRPEFNVSLTKPELDLAAFPEDMWPQGFDVEKLSTAVAPLFRTDFAREKWVVTHGSSSVEIALDCGEIIANELSEPLCELELELLDGNIEDLLALARQLVGIPGLRAGLLSKAARGYHLAKGNPPRLIEPLAGLELPERATVEQGLSAALNLALNHWAWHEELWLRGNSHALVEILDALALVRHTLALFGGVVPRKASTRLRDLVTQTEVSLNGGESSETLAYGTLAATTRQALTEWLLLRGWRPFLDDAAVKKIEGSFKRFADINLSRQSSELRTAFDSQLGERAEDQLPRLARVLDSVHILAAVYPPAASLEWLAAWRELEDAVRGRQRAEIEQCRRIALAQLPFWAHSGKR
ncbi:inorganic triphosphatase [Salmonella enterica subsp. enterica serovar Choleraesuis]|nr:inorganic triphosphatase [Salmonella enterica subsp. enterica serovar Choleraesuis]